MDKIQEPIHIEHTRQKKKFIELLQETQKEYNNEQRRIPTTNTQI